MMNVEPEEQPVFVVQLPSYLTERWKEARNMKLAKLTVKGGETPRVSLKLEGDYAHDLPTEFTGVISVNGARVFQECESHTDEAPSTMKVSGPVLQMSAQVQMWKRNPETGQMEVDKNVSRLAREKNAEEKRKVKSIATKEMSFSDGRERMQPLPSMLMRQRKNQLYDTRKRKREKYARCERSALERMLFSLFEERDQWNVLTLQTRTKQPISWLKEVLSDIAVLQNGGVHNGMYELKPEFKRNEPNEDSN